MSIDARTARLAVLVGWTSVFGVLWLTGSADRFLGPRTLWVAPFGALALAFACVAYGLSLRATRERVGLTAAEATSLVLLLVPVGGLLLVSNATLGSFAAGRKESGYFLRAAPSVPASPRDVSFLDIRVAEGDPQFAVEAGIANGLRVRLTGLLTGAHGTPPGTVELARFYIACCIADAQPVGVPVAAGSAPAPAFPKDTWLQVTGTLERRGKRFVVVADRIRRVPRPAQPYLSFQS